MKHKNLFKKLLWTANLSAGFRILAALGAVGYFGSPLSGLVTFIFCAALTDFFFLRPVFKSVFLDKAFSEHDIAWLLQKQDISPEGLMVFFRKILTFRTIALLVATIVGAVGWIMDGYFWVQLSPFVYVGAVFLTFASLQKIESQMPKGYRPTLWACNARSSRDYESLSNQSNVHSPLNPAHPLTRLRHTYWH